MKAREVYTLPAAKSMIISIFLQKKINSAFFRLFLEAKQVESWVEKLAGRVQNRGL